VGAAGGVAPEGKIILLLLAWACTYSLSLWMHAWSGKMHYYYLAITPSVSK